MEKQLKLKHKILKILPKAAAAVTVRFENPFSPVRDHKSRQENARLRTHHGVKGFSGPIVSMIPDEARRKPNHGCSNNGIDYQEPTSPKISCMGQIKHKKKQIKKAKTKDIEIKKHMPTFQKMLFYAAKPKSAGRKSDASAPHSYKDAHVSQMKRFASGRDAFANFDWKAQMAAEEIDCCYSDEDRLESDGEEEEDHVIIPFSAPILVGGVGDGCILNLKPRKEINLWKRRTMERPIPLQLNPVIIRAN